MRWRDSEASLARLLLLLAFCNGAARSFMRSAAYALFLATFSAQQLSYVYMAVSLLVAVASFAYLRIARRVSLSRLLPGTIGALMIAVLLLWAGLGVGGGLWLIFSLPIIYEALLVMTNLSLWTTVGRLLNVQQVKRLSGLISSGEPIAAVLCGLLMAPLVALLGTPHLLLLAALALGASLAGAAALARLYSARLAQPAEAVAAPSIAGRPLRPGRYIPLTFTMLCLTIVSFYFIDNIYYAQAQLRFPDPGDLAGFIGLFNAVVAVVWALTNAFVIGALLRRYGLGGLLISAPAMLAASTLALVAAGAAGLGLATVFGLAVLNKLLSRLAYDGFVKVSLNVIYQPLPAGQRLRVQALTEGVIYALAIGATGLLLLALTGPLRLDAIALAAVLLAVILGWLLVALLLLREYPRQLLRALNRRALGGGSGLALADPASRALLRRALHDPQPGAALYALQLLVESDDDSLADMLPDLLSHPVAAVRSEALLVIGRRGAPGALAAVRALLAIEPDPTVRGAAARALAALGGDAALPELATLLLSPDRPARIGAAAGLLRGAEGAARLAQDQIARWAASSQAPDRATAAEAIGAAGWGGGAPLLADLLADPDPTVRRAALRAAGHVASPALWPEVCAALSSPAMAGVAAAALSAGGPAALAASAEAFTAAAPATQRKIAQLWGRAGEAATPLLVARLDSADPTVRAAMQTALARHGYRPAGPALAALHECLRAEVAIAAWALASLADCADAAEPLLGRALLAELSASQARALTLLGLIGEPQTIARARAALASSSAEQRAYALELIETQAPGELRAPLVAMLGDQAPEQRLRQLAALSPRASLGRDDRLGEIIRGAGGRAGPWLRACAIDAAASVCHRDLGALVAPLCAAPEAVLRETAARHAPVSNTVAAGGPAAIGGAAAQEGGAVLSRIERVLILKTVELFSETPDEVLVDIAGLLHEVEVEAGELIFHQGDAGTSMYVIVEGEVRVHDGGDTLNHLHTRDVFGEMALLDPGPRVASVTAVAETRLLRLDQEPFYELMDERNEMARGIIRILTRHLRHRVRDLAEARGQLARVAVVNDLLSGYSPRKSPAQPGEADD